MALPDEFTREEAVPAENQPVPVLKKPMIVTGSSLVFRDADTSDARFIVSLRTDERKGRYLSATSPDVNAQVAWLEKYKSDQSQVYFTIWDRYGERVGTVRLYDQQEDSFCWGSWILKSSTPSHAIESVLMVYQFALSLGFRKSHFQVRKDNKTVWRFHESFGATRIGEHEDEYHYTISIDAINQSIDKYKRFLPDGIRVQWLPKHSLID